MLKHGPLLALLAAILLAPILLRPKQRAALGGDAQTLVIITPHNEAIRYEFSHAFEAWYSAKTGHRVHVDWRTPGGTSEIARYIASEYFASFQDYWTRRLGRPWSKTVETSFDNPKIVPGVTRRKRTLKRRPRAAPSLRPRWMQDRSFLRRRLV